MYQAILSLFLIIAFSWSTLFAQVALPADEGMLDLSRIPGLRYQEADKPLPGDPITDQRMREQLAHHLVFLNGQVTQLADMQDQLEHSYQALISQRGKSQEALANLLAKEEAPSTLEDGYREEILLLEQQITQYEQQLTHQEVQRRLQQHLMEDLLAQIEREEELQVLWNEMETMSMVSP